MKPKITDDVSTWPVELLRILEPEEVEQVSSLSWDTFKRDHSDKVIKLSARRVGVRLGHALMMGGK